jgi:hypothetical protein
MGTQKDPEIRSYRPTVLPCTIKHQPDISAQWAHIYINGTTVIGVQHFMDSMVVVECLGIWLAASAYERVDNIEMVFSHLADAMESNTIEIAFALMKKLNNFHQTISS